ncbi:MAG: tRNA (adenosine(37)-N6)-threonylcarbamoyltransferase complex dimerization subunit type 1 TsaB [Dehalococcoidales bacterium]|nr:tRNA (adenosine(37)-N6)-threonylcarbamoyltransferase complex dimerization subunit type 1 TsaB [Dehalococcoidales bacterium]
MQLAIDTSTDTASLALTKDGKVYAELTWCCGRNHSVQLLPRLANLLSQAGLSPDSLSGIIVARGPGSYNGLRVGISTAKGLAFSLRIPIVGISTLEAAAYQHAETNLPICPIFQAGRGEIATAIYQTRYNRWHKICSEQITTLEALCSEITTRTIFCGEITPLTSTRLRELLRQKALIASPAARLRRGGFLAELGEKQLKAGSYDNPATLNPLYLRRPHITRPKKSRNMESQDGN